MAKFCGVVGYSRTIETSSGVYEEAITEKTYYGDVIRNSRQWSNGEQLNDNLNINNSISIVADDYAYENFGAIRYLVWMGQRWKVSNVEVQRPRLTLTIGGVYNGPTA